MYGSVAATITIFSFLMTVILIIWRPKDLNEAIPSSIGALLVLISGTVSLSDFAQISATVSGAAISYGNGLLGREWFWRASDFLFGCGRTSCKGKRLGHPFVLVCQFDLLSDDTVL